MPAWYRFYNEALDDRKLKRIARNADQPFALVLGAWSILMALANNDYERGELLLSENVPLTLEDLLFEIGEGIGEDTARAILGGFQDLGLIAHDPARDAYYLPAFSKRQYESDNSTERVRRFRERQQQDDDTETADAAAGNGGETPGAGSCNGDETLPQRFSNGSETEAETEAETETEQTQRQTTDSRTRALPRDGPVAAADFEESVRLLSAFGIDNADTLARASPLAHVRGWIEIAKAASGRLESPTGLVVARLRAGIPPPAKRSPDEDAEGWRRFVCKDCGEFPCVCPGGLNDYGS